jgi:hypothetical protein
MAEALTTLRKASFLRVMLVLAGFLIFHLLGVAARWARCAPGAPHHPVPGRDVRYLPGGAPTSASHGREES